MHDVSFDVAKAEVVALVGESGSGKTTISRCVGGLHKQWTGELDVRGPPAGQGLPRAARAEDRKRIQYIFQNPYLSLNPRLTIEQIVKRPMELFGIAKGKAATRAGGGAARRRWRSARPCSSYQANRLSGGERQRVAIARALAAEPDLLVCDEITSALDVSVQGSIVALLEDLRKTRADQHALRHPQPGAGALHRGAGADPQRGRVVESGFVVEVLDTPKEEYTKRLLANCPRIELMCIEPRSPVRRDSVDPRSRRGRYRRGRPPPTRARCRGSHPSRSRRWTLGGVRTPATATHGISRCCVDGQCSCTPGTPTGSARATCFLGASMTKSVLAHLVGVVGRRWTSTTAGRRLRAGAGRQRLPRGARCATCSP